LSTLANIRTKVRRLTGRPSPQQITDAQIDEYVNAFYQYDFPEHLRIFSNNTTFKFLTTPNVDTYDLRTLQVAFDGGTAAAVDVYYNLQPPVYIEGYQSFYSQDREQFFRIYPALGNEVMNLRGNGTPGPYSFTLPNVPSLQNTVTVGAVDITNVAQTAIDVPQNRETGTWQDILLQTPITGSINYLTGAGTITFPNAIPTSEEITVTFTPYEPNRPQAVLFYDNIITLRPVPDKVYPVELNAFLIPTALINASDQPLLRQWWQYLAYGAAKKIFEDSQDPDGIEQIFSGFKEQERLVLYRSIVQQTNERTATIYTEMTQFPYGNFNNRF
jgi:hypothetical protein